MMTTCAAMLGALPLAFGFGDGGELRRPLGISIVGGLMVSQVLTLYTTPVVYLYLDRFRLPRNAVAPRLSRSGYAEGRRVMLRVRLASAWPAPSSAGCRIGRRDEYFGAVISPPVATTLLTIGLALAGMLAFLKLPVSPLPQVDFPTISVKATLPGASPEIMASAVATPLERHLGQIADVTEMTSISSVESVRIVLQFGLGRDINGAARDVQAAINAARADLPTTLRSNPTFWKVNPADAPIVIFRADVADADGWAVVRRRR